MVKKLAFTTALSLILTVSAYGQSSPGFVQGKTLDANTNPSPGSNENTIGLNNAFQLKQDYPITGQALVGAVTGSPAAGPITGSESLYIIQSGSPVQTTAGALTSGSILHGTVTPGDLIVGGTGTSQVQDGASLGASSVITVPRNLSLVSGTINGGSGVWLQGGGNTGLVVGTSGNVSTGIFNRVAYYVDSAPYSAVGNGTSDDQGPINSALSACGSNGGGIVVLGPHRYLASSANITVPQGCTLSCPNSLLGETVNLNYSTLPYTVILGSGVVLSMGSGTTLSGCNVISQAVATSSAWNDFPNLTTRDLINLQGAYTGTGVQWSNADVAFRNVFVGGFATGMNGITRTARTRMDHVNLDDTICLHMDNSHDISRLSHVECWPFITTNYANTAPVFNISNIANSGSGAYRVTFSSPTSVPQTGDTVWISFPFVGPQSIQGNRWTIQVVDTSNIDLVGSSGTGGSIVTGNPNVNTRVICGLSTMANLNQGQVISGANLASGTTTISWVSPTGSVGCIGISPAAVSTGTATSLTITDTAYGSAGQVKYDTNFRSGNGFDFQSSEGIQSDDLFTFGHVTGFHLGTGMGWFACVNCWNDGGEVDNTYQSVLIDGSAKGTTWTGGRLNGMAVHVVSTVTGENHVFQGVIMDALQTNNPVPMTEIDLGAMSLIGNVSNNGNGFYFTRAAATNETAVGNRFAGSWEFENGSPIASTFSGIGNVMSSNTFTGNLNLASSATTLGGNATTCGSNTTNSIVCYAAFGGQFADLTMNQVNVTGTGATLSGFNHANLMHVTGTVSTFTVVFPQPNLVGQEINLYFDGVVNTLNTFGQGGSTIQGMPSPTVANTWYKCMANAAKSIWLCGQG